MKTRAAVAFAPKQSLEIVVTTRPGEVRRLTAEPGTTLIQAIREAGASMISLNESLKRGRGFSSEYRDILAPQREQIIAARD